MVNIMGVVGEKIDEENIRLTFADGSSLCITLKEEKKSEQNLVPTVAHLVRLVFMEDITKEPAPGAVSIDDKPGIH